MTENSMILAEYLPSDEWMYSVAAELMDDQGLYAVQVVVEQRPEYFSAPVSCSIIRWMIDPNLEYQQNELEAEEAMLEEEEASASTDTDAAIGGAATGGAAGGSSGR